MKRRGLVLFIAGVVLFGAFSVQNVNAQNTHIITCSGNVKGFITIKKENNGRIVITPTLTEGMMSIDNEMCSLVPTFVDVILVSADDYEIVIIDKNTVTYTYKNGSWFRKTIDKTIDRNTTIITQTVTSSGGEVFPSWIRRTVDGNITTCTSSGGSSWTEVIAGNTTTTTYSDGTWITETIDGNTKTITFSSGSWVRKTINGNKKTTTFSSGGARWDEILDSQGNTISIHKESGKLK